MEDLLKASEPIAKLITRLQDIEGTIKTVATEPTGSAINIDRQIKLYQNKLYIYDTTNNTWLKIGGLNSKIFFGTKTNTDSDTIACGFQPLVIIMLGYANQSYGPFGIGFYDCVGNDYYSLTRYTLSPSIQHYVSSENILYLLEAGGTTGRQAWIDDVVPTGFTIKWSVISSASVDSYYGGIALG